MSEIPYKTHATPFPKTRYFLYGTKDDETRRALLPRLYTPQ